MQTFDATHLPTNQRALIEASAGTGKTYAITTLLIRLLLERGLPIDQILVVTFTEAATAELKQRIRLRLKRALKVAELLIGSAPDTSFHDDDRDLMGVIRATGSAIAAHGKLQKALSNFDDAAIFTIHGFCHRTLIENSFLTNAPFDAELLQDTRPLVQDVLLDFWANQMSRASLGFVEALAQRGLGPNELVEFAAWVSRTRPLQLLPATPPSVPEPDLSKLDAAYKQARASWNEQEVCDALLGADINRNKYREASVRTWVGEWSERLQSATAELPLFDKWQKFTNAEIEKAKKKSTRTLPSHAFFDACDALLEPIEEFERYVEAKTIEFKLQLIETTRMQLERRKARLSAVTFDDLLHKLHDALKAETGSALASVLRRRFPVALIDEFQDTDPVQYAIFDRIYPGERSPLFMIGDPKQAIYSFRGADIFAYLDAANSVPENQRHTMATNYRSAPELVEAVGSLFEAAELPFYFESIRYPSVVARAGATQRLNLREQPSESSERAPLQFRFVPGEKLNASFKDRELPALVAAEVRNLLESAEVDGKRVTPGHIAILTRTNREAFQSQAALLALDIPAVVLGDRSVYEQTEAAELELILSAVMEPANGRALRAALLTGLIGLDARELINLEQDDALWDVWVSRVRVWNQRWHDEGFVQMIRQLIDDCAMGQRLLELTDGQRRMTNLLHLVELLHTQATTAHLGPSGLLQYLIEQRQERTLVGDSEQIRLESDQNAVVLTTIHKSKGLEYPIVICPTLHNGMLVHPGDRHLPRFHDEEHDKRLTLYLGSDDKDLYEGKMATEVLAENLRLLYVALTRARYRCIVFWGKFWGHERSALAYLLHSSAIRGEQPPSISRFSETVKKLSERDVLQAIRDLDPSQKRIAVSTVRAERTIARYERSTPHASQLRCRQVDHEQRRTTAWRRTASFTSLTARAAYAPTNASEPLIDEAAQLIVEPALLEGHDYDTHTQQLRDESTSTGSAPIAGTTLTTLAEFPGGTRTGNFFHDVLEHLDFGAEVSSNLVQALVVEKLADHGLSNDHLPTVTKALDEILATQIQPGFELRQLPNSARLNELEFTLPARADARDAGDSIVSLAIADAFSAHPSPSLPKTYTQQLRELGFAPLVGFLKGFVDLTFVWENRWYVVDYKTNKLGPHVEDYGSNNLQEAMTHSHYVLQYHLYTLAVHRYLKTRLNDYDYDRDFGGVLYLFLRGMHPSHGQGRGVFFDKPPLTRIEALSALFR